MIASAHLIASHCHLLTRELLDASIVAAEPWLLEQQTERGRFWNDDLLLQKRALDDALRGLRPRKQDGHADHFSLRQLVSKGSERKIAA